MADEHERIEEMRRGTQARAIMDNPLWHEAWENLEQTILNAWRESPTRDEEGREALWVMLKVAERVKGHIKTVLETGQMAEMQIADLRKRRERRDARARR